MKINLALALLITASQIFAQTANPTKFGVLDDDIPKGLQVGDGAPNIQLSDQHGNKYDLSEALKNGPVVLTFYRGNWCPHCNRYLDRLTSALPEIEGRGASLVCVSPEAEDELVRTSEEEVEGKVMLLSDVDHHIMIAYDVDYRVTEDYVEKVEEKHDVDLLEHNDQEEAVLPVAATFVINKDGMIVYRHFDLDYSNRAPIDEILAALQQ